MYNIKGPSKMVAKSTRRGISQNVDTFRDNYKNCKSVDSNDNELINGPKPVFNNSVKRITVCNQEQDERITPQHEEIIKYIQESWTLVCSDLKETSTKPPTNKKSNHSVLFYEDDPCPHLQDFKPFDLESWWGKRLYNIITNSVNSKIDKT
ncbi:hypothetical protein RN001_009803 [Aquatica leii]|uniref:MAPK regulated corepressor interacting protein 2 n=1 Tax=Aquatica leii TaxID=1421715 RepID=A0AAN7PVR4_9COLE|nr:hypothetical protein RN001_009803 [Aquatica leii]